MKNPLKPITLLLFAVGLMANASESPGTWTGEGATKLDAFQAVVPQFAQNQIEEYRITSITYKNIQRTSDAKPVVSCCVRFVYNKK